MSNGFPFLPSVPPVGFGPGSQPVEGAEFTSMVLPATMRSYVPHVPDVSDPRQARPALKLLAAIANACDLVAAGGACGVFDLSELECDSRALLAETLGQGEVSMTFGGEPALTVQESVFAGVWILAGAGIDRIEAATIPGDTLTRAHRATTAAPMFDMTRQAGVVNAPALLTEIAGRSAAWRPGQPPHVINLSLLPHTPEDLAWLEAALGQGAVAILSRGYGNCRIAACAAPWVWRVQFFNSMDALILDSFEVTEIPEVALAAPEDLAESGERIREVLEAIR